MRGLIVGVFLLGLATSATAQTTVTATSTLQWDQPNATVTQAQGLTYRLYVDGSATGLVLTSVTCSGTTTITCGGRFPSLTAGAHTGQLTAGNTAGESAKSTALSFTFVVLPSVPTNLRIGI